MVEKSVKPSSSKDTILVETTSQALGSRPLVRNLKVCGQRGVSPSQQSDGDRTEDLSDICDAEVAGYLNNKENFLLKKIVWEMMNPDYQQGKQRKSYTGKKKEPVSKIAPCKKTSATRTNINTESENKKRPSSQINYDVLDKLFDVESSPKRVKFEKPVNVGNEMRSSQQSSEECLLKPRGSEEPDWDEDYTNGDTYGGVEGLYGDADPEFEEQDEEDNEDIIW